MEFGRRRSEIAFVGAAAKRKPPSATPKKPAVPDGTEDASSRLHARIREEFRTGLHARLRTRFRTELHAKLRA